MLLSLSLLLLCKVVLDVVVVKVAALLAFIFLKTNNIDACSRSTTASRQIVCKRERTRAVLARPLAARKLHRVVGNLLHCLPFGSCRCAILRVKIHTPQERPPKAVASVLRGLGAHLPTLAEVELAINHTQKRSMKVELVVATP